MVKKRLFFLFTVLILFLGLIPLPLLRADQSPGTAETLKIQPFLLALAATEPDDVVTLIVQTQGRQETAEAIVKAGGGRVTKEFPLINAFAAQAPVRIVNTLATTAAVRWVALDAPVMAMDADRLAATDDFAEVAYNGNNGTYAWRGNWQEVGEADGAALGDIAVTPFWGGALQGLRLQGAAKGVWRQVDLTTVSSAQVNISYRRKSFMQETDFVIVEISGDGGESWQELGRLAGPVTDAELHYVSYDLSAYRFATTAIRLLTSSTFGESAKFYVDYIAVDLTPAAGQQAVAANTLYLPLVAKDSEDRLGRGAAADLDTKADLLNNQHRSVNDQCAWYCIDLTILESTFVKAIGADQLWNSAQYLRGQGVTVAVVDSGIARHPDLNDYDGNSRLLQQVNFVPDNMAPDDYYGHGTHIAGTIAGLGQASAGVYLGVAPEAQLLDVRVMNDRGHGNTSNVIEGLQWIYDHRDTYGIKVVNLSLNSRIPESYHTSALNAALEVLWFNHLVVVVSAGNGGKQRLYPPANDPFVLTIGSANDQGTPNIADDKLSTFSAYGMTADGFLKPDLVAPGGNIVSLLASDDSNLLAAFPNRRVFAPNHSSYFKMSGTSMASAVAAGAVALLLEDEPELTPDQVKYRLRATAKPFVGPESCAAGAGYLDLVSAVQSTTTASANLGLPASQMLWSGIDSPLWGSVSWNSVSWNSVSWNSGDTDGGSSNGSCVSAIAGLTLVNADSGADLRPLYDGAVVNLDAIGTTNLAVRADVAGSVESVKFTLAGTLTQTQVSNEAPYRLVPQAVSDINSGSMLGNPATVFTTGDASFAGLGAGIYTLNVASYTDDHASGVQGGQTDLEFAVAGATRCELESLVRPTQDVTPIALRIHNNSNLPLDLFTIGYNGQRISEGAIAPGETKVQTTYATHPWLIARPVDGLCLHLLPDAADEPELVYPLAAEEQFAPPVDLFDQPLQTSTE